MSVTTRVLTGEALAAALEDVARLRIRVFRDFPYLYDGDADYERDYLRAYQSPGAVVVAAMDGDRVVGAATGAPMADHAAVKHDYHILPPDPWPMIGSFSALAMAAGGIMWMHGGHVGKPNGGGWLFFARNRLLGIGRGGLVRLPGTGFRHGRAPFE